MPRIETWAWKAMGWLANATDKLHKAIDEWRHNRRFRRCWLGAAREVHFATTPLSYRNHYGNLDQDDLERWGASGPSRTFEALAAERLVDLDADPRSK